MNFTDKAPLPKTSPSEAQPPQAWSKEGGGKQGQPSVRAGWGWGRGGLLTFRAPSRAQSHWDKRAGKKGSGLCPAPRCAGPAEGLLEEASTHIPCLQQVAGHSRASFFQAPGYTLTTLSNLGCYPWPQEQCVCKLSLGLGLQTIHSFIHSTNIYCGTSVAVQWLRLCFQCRGHGFDPRSRN